MSPSFIGPAYEKKRFLISSALRKEPPPGHGLFPIGRAHYVRLFP